jgi:hypothetical protein
MSAQPILRRSRRSLVAATAAMALLAGSAVVLASAPAGAYPKNKPIQVVLDDVDYAPGQIITATVKRGQPGCKVKVALSGNNEGGSAKVTVGSDGTVEVDFNAPPVGSDYRITATVVTKSCLQESAFEEFDVIRPTVTGPSKVAVGSVAKIKATGYPPNSTITWRVTRNGKRITSGTTTANGKGNSSLKVEATTRGNYSVKATSGKFSDSWAFAAS